MVVSDRLKTDWLARVVLGLAAVCLPLVLGVSALAGSTRLFEEDQPLPLVLEGPWREILRDRQEKPVAPGRLILGESPETGTALDARIKIRGRWRLEHCGLPPLTLEIVDELGDSTPLAGHPVLHLTPQCRPGKKFRQHLVQEYLIFRAYGQVTEVALRARLAALELRDTETRKTSWSGYAVLVEDIGIAAERLGLEWSERESVGRRNLDPDATVLFALFQFMIGHTDWSITNGPENERCCHNAALLVSPDSSADLLPVPYDFDASGLVDTGEIDPSDRLPIHTVRQRLYRGFCIHNARVPSVVERMKRSRRDFEALIEGAELLSPKSRRRAEQYLEDFYEIVENPAKLESRVLDRCRD